MNTLHTKNGRLLGVFAYALLPEGHDTHKGEVIYPV